MKKTIETYFVIIIFSAIILLAVYLNTGSGNEYLTFATWGTLEELESYQKLCDIYNSKKPLHPVRLIHITGEYDQKILVMSAANNTPDVFKTYNGIQKNFYRNNIIENLDEYINRDSSIDIAGFYDPLVKMARIDSKQIAIPLVFSTLVLYYNKNHFDMEGLRYPDSTWNWNDFIRAAKKLTRRDKNRNIVRYGCYLEVIRPVLIKQWGGYQYNESRDSSMMATEKGAEALEFFVNLYKKDSVSFDPAFKGFRTEEIFSSERASMLINGRWATPWFAKTMKKGSFDVAPVPKKDKPMTGLAAHFLAMAATSKKKDEAWDFIKFLTSPEAQKLTSEYGNNIPARKLIAESDIFLKNKNTPDINNKVFLDGMKYAVEWQFEESPYVNPYFMIARFDIARDKASSGELTAIQALKEYDTEVNRVIQNEKYKSIPKPFFGSNIFYFSLLIIFLICFYFIKRVIIK